MKINTFDKLTIMIFLGLILLVSCTLPSSTPTMQPTNETKHSTTEIKVTPTLDQIVAALPKEAELSEGWNQIDPGGETSCARNGKYSFFVRRTNSDKLLIYFEGGGSCYDAQTCREGGKYFDDSIDASQQADNPALKKTGVFALTDERNPFHNYNMVFITYCTGDAFMGNKTTSYSINGETFQVKHKGYENTRVALNWTYQNFAGPKSVFVIGCSAGTVGSFFHAPDILEHYPYIPVVFVGDSGGGYLDGPASVAESFGLPTLLNTMPPEYKNFITEDSLRTRFLFTLPNQLYPDATFALLDTTNDHAQDEIIQRLGMKFTLADLIAANLEDIRTDAPNFLSYTGPGDYHCITMHPDFINYKVNGISLRDWFADLANGKPVKNISP